MQFSDLYNGPHDMRFIPFVQYLSLPSFVTLSLRAPDTSVRARSEAVRFVTFLSQSELIRKRNGGTERRGAVYTGYTSEAIAKLFIRRATTS